ncbi:MAG: hypothetical protein ACF8R7_07275 [Phycisphaerales bacterium JB039]
MTTKTKTTRPRAPRKKATSSDDPDRLMRFEEAAASLPIDRGYQTVYRWARQGLKTRDGSQVFLRHVRVGVLLCTKRSWLDEFFEELSRHDMNGLRSD